MDMVDFSRKKKDGCWSPLILTQNADSVSKDVQSIFMESPKKKQVMMRCHERESGSIAGLS